MSIVPVAFAARPTRMSDPSALPPPCAADGTHAGAPPAPELPAPWVALTKGECLMLALALHRLSRAQERASSATEEEPR